MKYKYSFIKNGDYTDYSVMIKKLWPHCSVNEIKKIFNESIKQESCIVVVCKYDNQIVGFANISIRNDYVEGTKHTPVSYLEGIFVDEDYRKMGIAKKMIKYSLKWCKEKGCTEYASDTTLDNIQSQLFHKCLGFREVNKIVCFVRKI